MMTCSDLERKANGVANHPVSGIAANGDANPVQEDNRGDDGFGPEDGDSDSGGAGGIAAGSPGFTYKVTGSQGQLSLIVRATVPGETVRELTCNAGREEEIRQAAKEIADLTGAAVQNVENQLACAVADARQARVRGKPGAVRRYFEDLPSIGERVELARTYLKAIDPGSDSWTHEPQARAADYVILDLAVDPPHALDLLAEFNLRCNAPLSEAELDKLISRVDAEGRLRGRRLVEQVKERPDDPHLLAGSFLRSDCTGGGESRWRYWKEEWYRWDDRRYVAIAEKEVRGRLTAFTRDELVRHNQEECRRLRHAYESQRAARVSTPGKAPPQPPVMPTVIPVTSYMINNTMQALASMTLLPFSTEQPCWLDPDDGANKGPRYIAFRNGLIELDAALARRATLLPHSPRWFSTVCLPFDWDPAAKCSRWGAALHMTFGGDAQRISLLQEWFGYCLVPGTDQQKFLMLVGEGNNGKSVICAALTAVLGQDNVSNVSLEAFAERFSLTATLGKLANIAAKVGELDKTAEGKLKSFTSGDRMTFDRKNKTPVEAVPTARLVLATNNLPRFSDRTNGLWRRLLWYRATSPSRPRSASPAWTSRNGGNTPANSLASCNGALAGLQRLRQQGKFTEPEACREAVKQHRTESNPARAFLLEHCTPTAGMDARCEDVYRAYTIWCNEHGYRQPLATSQFGKEIARAFPDIEHKNRGSRASRYIRVCGLAARSGHG